MNKLILVISLSISFSFSSCEIDDEKEKIDRLAQFAMHDSVIVRSERYLLRCKEEEKANIHYLRSVAFSELNNKNKAFEEINKAIEIDTKGVLFFLQRGGLYEETGDTAKAIADYLTCVNMQINSANRKIEHAECNNRLSQIYLRQNKLDEALKYINKALSINDTTAIYFYNQGLIFFEEGYYDKSLKSYENALLLDPTIDIIYYGSSLTYWKINDTLKTLFSINKAIELAPRNSLYLVNRGRLNYLMDNKIEACKDFEQAASLGSDKGKMLSEKYCSDTPVEPNLSK